MNFQEHREIINKLKRQLTTPPSYDMLSVLLSELQYTMEDNPELSVADRDFVITYSGYIKKWATTMYVETMEQQWDDLYWRTMLFEAPYLFESYLIYMEKDRNPEKRFYLPRRKSLKVVVDDLQDLEDGKLDFYGLSMPSRVGKSTVCIFYLSWIAGKRPNSHSAMGGHSGKLAKGFYGELLNLINTREYKFSQILRCRKPVQRILKSIWMSLTVLPRLRAVVLMGHGRELLMYHRMATYMLMTLSVTVSIP